MMFQTQNCSLEASCFSVLRFSCWVTCGCFTPFSFLLTVLGVEVVVPFFWREESFLHWRRADGIQLRLGTVCEVAKGTRLVWVVRIPSHLLKTYEITTSTDETVFSVKGGSVVRALKYVDQLYPPPLAMRRHMPADWLGGLPDQLSRL